MSSSQGGEVYKDPLDTDGEDSYNSDDYVDEETGAPQVIIEEDNLADPHQQRQRRKRMLLLGGIFALVVILSIIIVVPSVVLTKKNKKNNNKSKDDVTISAPAEDDGNRTSAAAAAAATNTTEEPVEGEDMPLPFPEVQDLTGFSADVLEGYASQEELKQDLTRAAQAIVNNIVLNNIRRQDQSYSYHHNNEYYYDDDAVEEVEAVADHEDHADHEGEEEQEEEAAVAVTAAKSAAAAADGGDDHKEKPKKKKNKKDGEDDDEDEAEPDIVAQDANYMYAAYGDYVMVWDNAGNKIEQLKMPEGETPRYGGRPPKSYINALFLTDDHLFVITQRYLDHRDYYFRGRQRGLSDPIPPRPYYGGGHGGKDKGDRPVLSPDKTEVRVYKKPQKKTRSLQRAPAPAPVAPATATATTSSSNSNGNGPMMAIDEEAPSTWNSLYEMPLVALQILQGHYNYGVLMPESNMLHVVTSSWLRMHFHGELDVHNFPWTTREGYAQEAAKIATDALIPQFVDGVMKALVDEEDQAAVPNMMKINSWNMEITNSEDIHYYDSSSVQNYNQISSINIDDLIAASADPTMMKVTKSSFFGPHVWSATGKDGTLILSMGTWQRDPETDAQNEKLFLIALKEEDINTDDGSTTTETRFHSVAEMPGRIALHGAQSTSFSVEGTDLRIATTVLKWYQYDQLWKTCGDIYYFEDRCMSVDNWIQCANTTWNCGFKDVIKDGGCPYTSFTCEEPDKDGEEEDPSSTENYVVVLDLVEPGDMKERGRVRVGKTHEAISSVYFDESHAFVTTYDTSPEFHHAYEQVQYFQSMMMGSDPNNKTALKPPELPPLKRESFYTVDIPAGQTPALHDHVEFQEGSRSTSLRPLDVSDERKLLLSLGRNFTAPESTTGEHGYDMAMYDGGHGDWGLITVLDISDPATPRVVASHMMNTTKGYDGYSDAEWDPKTVALHDGFLVVPFQMYPKWNYHYGHYEDEEYYMEDHDGDVEVSENVNEQEEETQDGEDAEEEGDVAEEIEEEIAKLEREEEAHAMAEMAHAGDSSMVKERPEQFRGFIVFDVSNVAEQGIVETLRINHARDQNTEEKKCRYCEGYFHGSRSYLFNDSNNNKVLATVTDQYFIGTNLNTGEELWAFSPAVEGEAMECCW